MELAELCLISFLVGFSGAASPGSVTLTIIKESADKGIRVGTFFSIGHSLIEMPVLACLFIGIGSALLKRILPFLGLIGGIFLVFIGAMTLREGLAGKFKGKIGKPVEPSEITRLIGLGASLSLLNPYWIMWWLTIGAAYVGQSIELGLIGLVGFYISHIAADFIVFIGLSALVSRGHELIGKKGYRIILLASGLLLVLIGGKTALDSLT